MNTEVLGRKFADFKSRFAHLFSSRDEGYDEIDTLERPLVSAVDGGDYDGENNGGEREQEPGVVRNVAQQQAVLVPSQHEELEMLTVLSKDAAEILWEMVLMDDGAADAADLEDMKGRAEQLKAQLRGMLNDYDGSDEALMCGALEAFDSLNSALNNNANETDSGNKEVQNTLGDLSSPAPDGDLLGEDMTDGADPTPPPPPQQQQQNSVPNLIDF